MRCHALGLYISLLAACRPGEPASTTPASVDVEATRARTKQRILGLIDVMAHYRGLPRTHPLIVDTRDNEDLLKWIEADIRREHTMEELELDRRIEISLGLRPAGSADDPLLSLPPSIGGLYDFRSNTLLVNDDLAADEIEYIMAHEVVHYLQDANFDLERLGKSSPGDSDGEAARYLLVEGDAQAACAAWETKDRTLASIKPEVDRRRGHQTLDAEGAFVHPIIGCTQMLSYNYAGSTVTEAIQERGWAAIDDLFREPPTTTEQMLHSDKLIRSEPAIVVSTRAEALTSALPNYTMVRQDNLGEAMIFCMLAAVVPAELSRRTAAGWGGDRIVVLQPSGSMAAIPLVLGLIAWDDANEAAEFEPVFRRYLARIVRGGYVMERRGAEVAFATQVPADARQRFTEKVWAVLTTDVGASPRAPG